MPARTLARRSTGALLALGAAVGLGAASALIWQTTQPHGAPTNAASPSGETLRTSGARSDEPRPTLPANAERAGPPVEPKERAPDEAELMKRLHELGETNPALSLELARDGNRLDPGGADAPERAWIVVKSLVNLGRFEEARSEAVVMVDTYKDTTFALDVERHLLTHPLTHPSERGYGKSSELETHEP